MSLPPTVQCAMPSAGCPSGSRHSTTRRRTKRCRAARATRPQGQASGPEPHCASIGCGRDPDKPDRLAPFLNDSGGAERCLVDELSRWVRFFRRSADCRRCRELRRPELAYRSDGLGSIRRESVCWRFSTRSFGRTAGIEILRERGAGQSSHDEKCGNSGKEPSSFWSYVHLPSSPEQIKTPNRATHRKQKPRRSYVSKPAAGTG